MRRGGSYSTLRSYTVSDMKEWICMKVLAHADSSLQGYDKLQNSGTDSLQAGSNSNQTAHFQEQCT